MTQRNYEKLFGEMFNQLVPQRGDADTILGNLLRIEENCYDEAYRNDNANWFDERNTDAIFLIENFPKVKPFVTNQQNYDDAISFLSKLKNYTVIWEKFLKDIPDELDDEDDEAFDELPEPFETQSDEYFSVFAERSTYTPIINCLIDAWLANSKTGQLKSLD